MRKVVRKGRTLTLGARPAGPELGAAPGEEWETLIALVLARDTAC
jgi:hypothetical protein